MPIARNNLFSLAIVALAALIGSVQGVIAQQDQLGDPLPQDAVTRVGTLRATDQIPADFPRPLSLRGAALSAEGNILATYGEPAGPRDGRPIQIWDAKTGKRLKQLDGHNNPIRAIAISPDGKTLVSSSFDIGSGTGVTRVWNVATGENKRIIPEGGSFVRFQSDNQTVWLGVRDSFRAYHAGTGQEVRRFLGPNIPLDLSSDGRFALGISHTRDSVLRMYHTNTRKEVLKIEGMEGAPKVARFSPDGGTIAVLDRSNNILVWEVITGQLVHQLIGHEKRPFSLAFSPDGRFLVTGGLDRTLRVWELATGEEIEQLTGHQGIVTVLEFAPQSNRLVSGSTDRTALVWNTAGTLISRIETPKFDKDRLDLLWSRLASGTPSKAFLAMGTIRENEETAWPFLFGRMEGLLVPSKNSRIEDLLKDLDDDDFRVRQRATRELFKLRKAAEPLLHKVLKETESAEVRARLRYILHGADNASRFHSTDQLRMRRLIQLSLVSEGPSSRELVELLADKCPLPEIAKEAQQALARNDSINR